MANNHGGARKGAGRPKKADEEKLRVAFDKLINEDEVVERLIDIVRNGSDSDSLKAINVYLDRRWGKVKENLDITSDGAAFSFKDMIRFANE